MSFFVNYSGNEKEFSSKEHAIKYMKRLDCGSDLWFGTSTLLISRVKQSDGTFEVTEYCYDNGALGKIVTIESQEEVLVLGKGMKHISLRDPEAGNPCVGPFTKVS